VVISPLLSLIQDQVSALIKYYSVPAAFLNSSTTQNVASQIYRDLYQCRKDREPAIKLLYLTPERIVKSEGLKQLLGTLHEHVSLFLFIHLLGPSYQRIPNHCFWCMSDDC